MRRAVLQQVGPRDGAGIAGRPLTCAEREVLHRLFAVAPDGAPVRVDGLSGIRVADVLGCADGHATHSLVVVGERTPRTTSVVPVRGFSVDADGTAQGEVVVRVAASGLASIQHRALRRHCVLPDLDPQMVDAVPWPAG